MSYLNSMIIPNYQQFPMEIYSSNKTLTRLLGPNYDFAKSPIVIACQISPDGHPVNNYYEFCKRTRILIKQR